MAVEGLESIFSSFWVENSFNQKTSASNNGFTKVFWWRYTGKGPSSTFRVCPGDILEVRHLARLVWQCTQAAAKPGPGPNHEDLVTRCFTLPHGRPLSLYQVAEADPAMGSAPSAPAIPCMGRNLSISKIPQLLLNLQFMTLFGDFDFFFKWCNVKSPSDCQKPGLFGRQKCKLLQELFKTSKTTIITTVW